MHDLTERDKQNDLSRKFTHFIRGEINILDNVF
jgi:hypothetical protein